MMTRNPVLNATLPKEEHQKREIWTAETLMHALEVCDDDILALAINLSFACSLRMGEMLGLTWDCIDISEESLKENNASIFVDKELQRVNRDVMEVLDNKDIIRVFPRTLSNTNTSLVLKTPKTKTSVRKIFLPSTVAQMLLERKKQIDEMKELFGDEYLDYDLVFCHSSGRPMEGQVINRALKKLIQDNDLPDVVFHSFRHASITYKLKWNGGDMKSVQGDSGHARMDHPARRVHREPRYEQGPPVRGDHPREHRPVVRGIIYELTKAKGRAVPQRERPGLGFGCYFFVYCSVRRKRLSSATPMRISAGKSMQNSMPPFRPS